MNIYHLDYFGIIAITGPDAENFLQGQLTCNVSDVTQTQNRFGAYCNPKGRIIATFRLLQIETGYLLILPTTMVEHLLNALNKYAIFSQITLTDVSAQYHLLGCQTDKPLIRIDSWQCPTPQAWTDTTHHQSLLVLGDLVDNHFMCLISQETFASLKLDTVQTNHFAWQAAQIKHGFPFLDAAVSEQFTPHDVGLPLCQAVSFKKGCYVGQEIIARMEFRGKPKKHLYVMSGQSDTPPTLGQRLYNTEQRAIGQIATCVYHPETQTFIAQAVIDDKASQSGFIYLNMNCSDVSLLQNRPQLWGDFL